MKNLLNLFFPKVCEACNYVLSDNEIVICTSCRHHLPITNFHFDNAEDVKKVLYGRVKLENATALLHFSKKGIVQQMLHNLKYKGHEAIGGFFGKWLGSELATIEAYKTIDVVVPVPLYKSKLRKRGYNQVAKFGKEIAKALNIDYNDRVLIKTKASKTQVFKGRIKRWNDDGALFDISENKSLTKKHILLVDDIITTGATIEACASVLLKIDKIKLSLATMAIAD
ncbi:ComF family protein [Winogradskyella sp.]|uniref:ComF family protein n=1 Tax=Winogradskyella sp. TaxID=1883156 RepID=UPI003AB7F54F